MSVPALRAMTDAIVHRGPDEDGLHVEAGVALGMRRLSIIDVAGSQQPVTSETGGVQAVFNGEIYNFRELREQLHARGHRFATNGDSETIVHLYEDFGLDFVTHLRGMFAIALWDRPRRRLVLARDRMGVKPLYWADTPRGLAFASEVKSLIAGGLIEPELDPMAAELFLAHGFVPGPRSLFAGVHKLPPASLLVYEDGKVTDERCYWNAYEAPAPDPGASWEDHQQQLLDLLRESVHARMITDVPLGVMLSGGLDSSLITALMAERSSGPVETFSIAFAEDAGSNELGDARRVAQRLGTNHHEITTSANDHPGPARRGALAPGGARRGHLQPRLPAALAARAQGRDRRALGPRRRRAARRLPQARDRGARRQAAAAAASARARRRRRGPVPGPQLHLRARGARADGRRSGRSGCWR